MTDHEHDRTRGRGPGRQPGRAQGREPGQGRDPGRDRDPGRGREPGRPSARENDHRLEDHAAIGRLTDELLPPLIAKLGATGLGEIEVREGDWKVRLRRPADASGPRYDRRASDRPSRAQPGHAGHGHAPAAVEPHRGAPAGRGVAAVGRGLEPVGPGHLADVATSPAVGFFQPRSGMTAGTKVRAGDTIATIDVLGVPQDVVAPVDGLIGASFVQPGEAVEYGQELIRIELPASPAPASPTPAADPASVAPAPASPTPAADPASVAPAPASPTPAADPASATLSGRA